MELVEEDNTVFKNKKIVLSSIAIIFALVVSSIFVNYTLANSDSQASVSDATGSGTTTGLTGLSNIDLAIENSNNAGKKATGEDKYRIVQIVSDDYAANAAMDTQLKETVSNAKFTGDAKKLTGYESTTYLWRYVYAGEYFRLAVFNGYKTIADNMAEGAVTLTTCTVSELNKRRGRVLGMEPYEEGMTEISAEVPMREMHSFTMYLKQVTRGMGSFTFDFLRYEQLPANLVAEVITESIQE